MKALTTLHLEVLVLAGAGLETAIARKTLQEVEAFLTPVVEGMPEAQRIAQEMHVRALEGSLTVGDATVALLGQLARGIQEHKVAMRAAFVLGVERAFQAAGGKDTPEPMGDAARAYWTQQAERELP